MVAAEGRAESFCCESCAAEHESVGEEDEGVCGGDSEAVMEGEDGLCEDKAL